MSKKIADLYGITLDIESFSLELHNCSERLRTSSDVLEKLWICLCRLQKSWYSPVKKLTPLTQKKLAGIEWPFKNVESRQI